MPEPSLISPATVRQVKTPYETTFTSEQMALFVRELKRFSPLVSGPNPVPVTTTFEPPALPTSGLIERREGVSTR